MEAPQIKRTRIAFVAVAAVMLVVAVGSVAYYYLSASPTEVEVTGDVNLHEPGLVAALFVIQGSRLSPMSNTGGCNAPAAMNEGPTCQTFILVQPFSCPPCTKFTAPNGNNFDIGFTNGNAYQISIEITDQNGNFVSVCHAGVVLSPALRSNLLTENFPC